MNNEWTFGSIIADLGLHYRAIINKMQGIGIKKNWSIKFNWRLGHNLYTWFLIKKPEIHTEKKIAYSANVDGQAGCLHVEECK